MAKLASTEVVVDGVSIPVLGVAISRGKVYRDGVQVTVRTPNDGLDKAFSDATALDCTGDPGMTRQADSRDADINNILARYERTGDLSVLAFNEAAAVFADATSIPSYEETCNRIAAVNSAFGSLPAKVRERFGHDPQKLIDAYADKEFHPELIKLGLMKEAVLPPKASPPVAPAAGEGKTA